MTIVTKFTNLIDYSPRQVYAKIQGRLFQKEKLNNFTDSCPCIFVLSTGRVGSKTLSALFQLTSKILAYHEPKPKLYALSKMAYQHLQEGVINEIFKESFLATRGDLLNYSLQCHKGYIETSPQVTFLAPIIYQVISNVKFIHVVRDPRMVVRSGMRRQWYENNPSDKTRIVPSSSSEIGQQWQYYSSFQKNAWLWAETNKWIINFMSQLPEERKIRVHSEDLFDFDEETVKRIFTFINQPMPSQRKIEKILGQKLNIQKNGQFPEPFDWSQSMYNDLISITGKVANQLGYCFEKE